MQDHPASPGLMPGLTLQTPRLLLRPLREMDRAEFVRVSQISMEFWRPWIAAASRPEPPQMQFEQMLETAQRGWVAGTHCRLVGCLADGRLAGFFSLSEIVGGVFQSAYAGWRVSVDAAGQGLGTEGVLALLDLAFASRPAGLALHRVQANIIPTNVPSLRVAEKCGLRHEGYALRYLKIAGRWQDHVMFARTAEEHQFAYLRP